MCSKRSERKHHKFAYDTEAFPGVFVFVACNFSGLPFWIEMDCSLEWNGVSVILFIKIVNPLHADYIKYDLIFYLTSDFVRDCEEVQKVIEFKVAYTRNNPINCNAFLYVDSLPSFVVAAQTDSLLISIQKCFRRNKVKVWHAIQRSTFIRLL